VTGHIPQQAAARRALRKGTQNHLAPFIGMMMSRHSAEQLSGVMCAASRVRLAVRLLTFQPHTAAACARPLVVHSNRQSGRADVGTGMQALPVSEMAAVEMLCMR
jgi:hypothetical protein